MSPVSESVLGKIELAVRRLLRFLGKGRKGEQHLAVLAFGREDLRGDIYEVRANASTRSFRLLTASC